MMMRRTPSFGWIALLTLAAVLWPAKGVAQEDEQSLGDVARSLRREKAQEKASAPVAPVQPVVIDNENLSEVVDETKRAKAATASKTVFSLDSSGNTLKVSSPDVTCSMSFNARASALLVRPALVESLPMEELVKLDGPGSIQNDNLHMEVFNGTEWALREVTVGLTLERRPGEDAEKMARARVIPASRGPSAATVERHSDVTLLYHLKTEVKPFTKTALRQSIGITPGPDEDWRWSIVEAKGIRPSGARTAPASLSTPLYGNRVPDAADQQRSPKGGIGYR
jgi:hypothetical protein